jgi:monooxygenase
MAVLKKSKWRGICDAFFKYFELMRLTTYVSILFAGLFVIYYVITSMPLWLQIVLSVCALIFAIYIFCSKSIRALKNNNSQKNVIIIGSGISGIAAAYYLQKKNIPYIILEKASKLGGTWRDNKFHGCRVDTINAEYCYSFEIFLSKYSTNWCRKEVMEYLINTAKKYGIFPRIEFNKKVVRANFDSKKNKWLISTSDGNNYCADFLYNCSGFSNTTPYIPDFKGKEDFNGEIIHSINLDDKRTFYDKDIVIIGSGATMVSMAPELVKFCKSLTIIQRSPSYIYESDSKPDLIWKAVRKLDLLGIPKIKYLYQIYRMIDSLVIFQILRKWQSLGKKFFRYQWKNVADKEFIDKHLTPKYNILEQRICVATGMKELILKKKIIFETDEISNFSSNGINLKSGKLITCDVCVLATGFDINFFTFPIEINNKQVDTKQLNWYKTLLLGGIPNYFHTIGCFDCSWTQRVESAYKLSSKIIKLMSQRSYNTVKVFKRTDLENTFVFKPNYILRKKNEIPIIYGISHNPTYDFFFSFSLFSCRELVFSK